MINDFFCYDIENKRSPFIIDPLNNITFTYGHLFNYATNISREKLINIQTGDTVLIISDDIYEVICHILACWIKNIIPAVLSPNLIMEEYETFFHEFKFKKIITNKKNFNLKNLLNSDLQSLDYKTSEISSLKFKTSDIAIILFSSGTTGKQKGIPLSFENIISNIESFSRTLNLSKESVFLCTSPVYFAHGLYNSIITSFFLKQTTIYSGVLNIFNSIKLLNYVSEISKVIYHITPSMIPILCSSISRIKNKSKVCFEKVICGTSFLDQESKLLFEKTFNTQILQQYGMTEVLFISINDKPIEKSNSVGKPLDIVDLKIYNDKIISEEGIGEIHLKSSSYYGDYYPINKIKNQNNYFCTGDLGYLDKDGYLFITGREKDLIKKGGLSISAKKIDEVLLKYNGITNAFTISKTDKDSGEEIYSFIEVNSDVHLADLKKYIANKISRKFLPKKILVIDKIPRNEMNKFSVKEVLKLINE